MELINLDSLNEKVRTRLGPYCGELLKLHGDNLKSISVYGSSAGEDFAAGMSNINLLVVMGRIDPPDLKKSLKLVSSGIKKKIEIPKRVQVA